MLASTHGNTDTIAMSGSRKKLLLNTVFVKLGCGTCRRPNLCRIFHPKPKPKNLNNTYRKHKHSSSSSSFFSGQWGGEDKCDSTSTTPTPTPTNTTFSNPIAASSRFSRYTDFNLRLLACFEFHLLILFIKASWVSSLERGKLPQVLLFPPIIQLFHYIHSEK